MTSVASLRAARATGATAYAEYIKHHPNHPDRCFIFVEGKDDCCFYGQSVQVRKPFVNIPCGNKDGVLDALAKVQNNRPDAKHCLFFVDKDLWDFLSLPHLTDSRLFVTEHYSFENYLVTTDALERVWQDLIGLSVVHPLYLFWKDQFQRQHTRFLLSMLPLMAWVLEVRARNFKARLGDLNLGSIFNFSPTGELIRKSNSGIDLWENRCILDTTYTRDVPLIRAKYMALKAHPQKKWLRGKWELWFMQEFIRVMTADVRIKVKNHVIGCDLHSGNVVQLIAPRIVPPAHLTNYLNTQLVA